MSKIKNTGLDRYGAEPFEQQQSGTAGFERVNSRIYTVESLLMLQAMSTQTAV